MAAIFLAPTSAWAQAALEVTVLGNGDPVARVAVTLKNEAIGFSAEATTDSRGKAAFAGLATAGSYVVRSQETGVYRAGESEGIQLRATFDRAVVLLLQRKDAPEEIVVVGRSITRLNTLNAEVSSTLPESELRLLPTEGRDITRALFRLPNVTQATGFYPEAPNIAINGANSLFTNYMIDGLDNNENFLGGQKFPTPVGFAQSVSVLANTYSAEYGRSANGIVNITSKSGNNDFGGEAFFVTRPGGLAKKSPFTTTDLSGNVVEDNFSRYQGGIAAGGPIVKDKTFYFADVEYTRDNKENQLVVPAFNINRPVGGSNTSLLASLRLDQKWSDDWSSSLRLNLGRVRLGRQAGGIGGGVTFPSAANSQDRTSTLAAFATTYTGDDFVYEGRLQYGRFRWNYGAAAPGPQVSVEDPSGQAIAVLGNPGYIFDDTENTYQTQQKVTFTWGGHTVKAGADVIRSRFSLTGGGNVNGNYTVRLTAPQLAALAASNIGLGLKPSDLPANAQVVDYSVELRPASFGRSQSLYGLYLEDQYAVAPRLTVTAGLRWDYDSLSKGGSTSGDTNNIAPRVSANYSLNERMALRGGVGVFYDKIPYTVISDALQGNSTAAPFKAQLQQLIALGLLPANTDINRITFDGNLSVNPNCTAYLACPTPAQAANLRATALSSNLRILNPKGYSNPNSLQATLGYQWQVSGDLLFYADAIYAHSRNLIRLVDLNAPAPFAFNGTPRGVAAANASRPVAPVPGGARSIVISDTGGHANYRALNLSVVKEKGDDAYSYRVSYTLSRLKNDTDDLNFRAQDANNFAADYGPSLNDRTHVISGAFYVFPLPRVAFSITGLLQSGQPVNFIPDARTFGTVDLNGDGQSYGDGYVGNSDRYPGATRNNGRLPWSKTFDIGVQYTLPVDDRRSFEIRADVFNIFDANNLSGYQVNFTASNQTQLGGGAPFVQRSAAPARTIQLSGRLLF